MDITNDTVDSTLRSHPDYPSLLSIGDSLDKWNVTNRIIKIEDADLEKLNLPCIAHMRNNEAEPFIIITATTADTIHYLGKSKTEKKLKRDEFLKSWSKIILLLKTGEKSGDPDHLLNKKRETAKQFRKAGLIIIAACLAILPLTAVYTSGSPGTMIYLILILLSYTAGLIFSILLTIHEFDGNNPLVKNICHIHKTGNCDTVLKSKASRPFKWLSWSEVGVFYFTGGLLALLFARNNLYDIIAGLSILSVLALPYILFSIIYQGLIARQWCLLCLGVQFTLALIFIINLCNQTFTFAFDPYKFLVTALPAYLIPTLLFYTFQPVFHSYVQKKHEARNFLKLKFNTTIFTALLQNNRQLPAAIPNDLCLTFGNGNAGHTLLMACSPLCNPCALAHKLAGTLIKQSDINLNIIFTIPPDREHPGYSPTKHLIQLYYGDKKQAEQALDSWFNGKSRNYTNFAADYPVPGNQYSGEADLLIQRMNDWCSEVKITYTPTLFFDGYLLPEAYSISDLSYFISK